MIFSVRVPVRSPVTLSKTVILKMTVPSPRISIFGGPPPILKIALLTSNSGERWPRCSPDGKWVVYASIANPPGLFKVSIEGGAPVPVSYSRLTGRATENSPVPIK